MNEKQAKKVIELLERNNELLSAIAQAMIQENEENRALMDLVLNKPKKDPFAAFNNQKMVQLAQMNSEEANDQLKKIEEQAEEIERRKPPPAFPYS